MKKLLIAAVLLGFASAAKAGEIKIDFDGKDKSAAGLHVRSEGDLETEVGHYHLTLQPPGQTGWGKTAPFDMDPLGVDCCPANPGDPIPDKKCTDLYNQGGYIDEDPVPPSDCI
ncbi:MAG: hypothetical protein FD189_2480 [Elusimicrobia bacterium]|nr:MAG: hypothetical protein FD154_2436 [Elusimicrobiota bacterium]KAF0152374.1 MAG: hypothetical protein FD189_2480 [Elusimicrobiota bacterium]